jgi:hypothetical protein
MHVHAAGKHQFSAITVLILTAIALGVVAIAEIVAA